MKDNPYKIQIKKRILLEIGRTIGYIISLVIFLLFFFAIDDFAMDLIDYYLAIAISVYLLQRLYEIIYILMINYSLDNKNLVFKGGVISKFEKIIPYSKIQHAIIYESFWQRIFGLASVSIETAREAGTSIAWNTQYRNQSNIKRGTGPYIPDLSKGDAERLKNDIISMADKHKSVAGI